MTNWITDEWGNRTFTIPWEVVSAVVEAHGIVG